MDLIELSDKYVFYELQKECEIFLSIILNDENLVRIAKKAERTQSDILLGRIKEFITKNITELQERRDLNEFPYYIGCYYNDVLFNIQSNFDEAALTEREKADLIPNFSSKQNNSDMREDLRE